jgi:thymidylate synthase (FAD)
VGEGIRFRSDIGVEVVAENTCGSDRTIACAAWAEHPDRLAPGRSDTPPGWRKVGEACMRFKHNSPFEQGQMCVYAEMPGVAWWQLTRQRFMSLDTEDFSFNLESGRYKHLDPEFYLPPPERPCREPDGFRPMRPELAPDANAQQATRFSLRKVSEYAWEHYESLIEHGVAREVARTVLPNWALYCDGWVTGKVLTWLQFFSKRNRTPDTTTPTFPQWEIEEFCRKCEVLFKERWPATYLAFVENGREAP